MPDLESVVDMTTFSQILEMDDPDDHSFSSSIVFDFFDQADQTFTEMDDALYVALPAANNTSPEY